ncbi:hypothetical protein [Bdellovibrio sp. NC01]|uniref:hypothetical protein n=1 Tax=Bdellovibrio sp. NC01 TaxID=2220073 RepID=UPI00115770D3|nr:hypothetical protein [Bdellovibrio sp. NC01]QDK36183.1 hypothetical protein DOE51_00475 [Bdellovibrio sp. NC01]
MKSLAVLVAGCMLSTSVFAQQVSVERLAQTVANEIQQKAYTLSMAEKAEISRKLQEIRRVVNRGGAEIPLPPPPPAPPAPTSSYTCVARDNDGKAPYVIGVREGLNVTRTKITFQTIADCETTIGRVRYVNGQAMLCVSRDFDGYEPYVMATLRGKDVQRYPRTNGSKGMCEDMLRSLQPDITGNAVFCTSRDSDGHAPFVTTELNIVTGYSRNSSETFQTMDSCKSFLGQ